MLTTDLAFMVARSLAFYPSATPPHTIQTEQLLTQPPQPHLLCHIHHLISLRHTLAKMAVDAEKPVWKLFLSGIATGGFLTYVT